MARKESNNYENRNTLDGAATRHNGNGNRSRHGAVPIDRVPCDPQPGKEGPTYQDPAAASGTGERYLPEGMRYTSEAYELLSDRWMGRLNGAEWKVLYYATRRTIGFGKPTDRISLGQFQHGIKTRQGRQLDIGTGLSRDAVLKALTSLTDMGLLITEKGQRNVPNLYGLNWPAITDSQKVTSQKNGLPGGTKNRPQVVRKTDPQLSVSTLSVATLRNTDSDYQTTNGKTGHSSPDQDWRQIASLIERILGRPISGTELSRITEAAGTMTEAEAVNAVNAAGTRSKRQPRTIKWFASVVASYRGYVDGLRPAAPARCDAGMAQDAIDEMTAAIELPDAG